MGPPVSRPSRRALVGQEQVGLETDQVEQGRSGSGHSSRTSKGNRALTNAQLTYKIKRQDRLITTLQQQINELKKELRRHQGA